MNLKPVKVTIELVAFGILILLGFWLSSPSLALAGCDSGGCTTSLVCGGTSYTVSCQQDCSPSASGCFDGQGRPVAGTAQMTGFGCSPQPYINCANVCACGGGGGGNGESRPTPTLPPATCAGSCGIVPGANGTSGCNNPIKISIDRESNQITLDWGCSYDWSNHPIWSGLKIYDEGLNRWQVNDYATKLEFVAPYPDYLDQPHTFTIYPRCESGDPPSTACRRLVNYTTQSTEDNKEDNNDTTPTPVPTQPTPNPDFKLLLIDAEAHSFNGFKDFVVKNQTTTSLLTSSSAGGSQAIIDSAGLGPPIFEAGSYNHQAVADPGWLNFAIIKRALLSSDKTKAVIKLTGQSVFNLNQAAAAINHSQAQAGVISFEGSLSIDSVPDGISNFILLVDGQVKVNSNTTLTNPLFLLAGKQVTVDSSVAELTAVIITDDRLILTPQKLKITGTLVAKDGLQLDPVSLPIDYSFTPQPALMVRLANLPIFSHRLFNIFSARETQPVF